MQLITVYIISCSNNSDKLWFVCLAIETKTSYTNHSCLNRRVVVMYHVAIQVSCVSCTRPMVWHVSILLCCKCPVVLLVSPLYVTCPVLPHVSCAVCPMVLYLESTDLKY